jgi:futalosine hydrolase
MTKILVLTAVPAERDAVLAGALALGMHPAIGMVEGLEIHRTPTLAGLIDVVVGGIGPVSAAVSACRALRQRYDLVISTGIAGGFGPADIGSMVVASAVVHADLGAQTPTGFTSMAEFGWGAVRFELDPVLCEHLAEQCEAQAGAVLSVSTVTGSRDRAAELLDRHPDALAEAMEGIGVYRAAELSATRFAELRAISNRVGPRNRDSWQIPHAIAALSAAFGRLLAVPLPVEFSP